MTGAKDDKDKAPRLCFVIGPIGKEGDEIRKHADMLLNALIKPVLQAEPFRYRVKRADEDADPGMISDRMITDIVNAELVVADLTGLNPNAFYELGIRHAREKPTIHVARTGTVLPFDNLAHRAVFVDLSDWHSLEKAKQQLADMARFIEQPDYKVSNPITQANASFKMRESADPRDAVIAEFREDVRRIEQEVRAMRYTTQEGAGASRLDGSGHFTWLRDRVLARVFTGAEQLKSYVRNVADPKLLSDVRVHEGDDVFFVTLVMNDGIEGGFLSKKFVKPSEFFE